MPDDDDRRSYRTYPGREAAGSGSTTPEPLGNISNREDLSLDLFNLNAQRRFRFETPAGNHFRVLNARSNANGDQTIHWELRIADVTGGLDVLEGDYVNSHDRTYSSSLETRFNRYLGLLPLTTAQTAPDPDNTDTEQHGMWSAVIFNTVIIGMGDQAYSDGVSASLFKATSDTNPALDDIDYTATSEIISLTPVNWGSATVAKHLLVGRLGDVAQTISAADGTVAASCDASVEPLWGAIQTTLPNVPILLYMNGTISRVNGTVAATTAPTAMTSNIPNGGYALDLLSLGGGPVRAYWVIPDENLSASMLLTSADKFGRIWHCNMEGTDMVPLHVPFVRGVTYAAAIPGRNAIAVSDDSNIIIHQGNQIIDTRWAANRVPDSDRDLQIRGFYVVDTDLYVEVVSKNSDFTGATVIVKRWIEYYNWETGGWHVVSEVKDLASGVSVANGASLPVSSFADHTLHNLYCYGNGSWFYVWQPRPGVHTYTLRKTSGAGSATGQAFATTGTWKSPYWTLPNLGGCRNEISEIIFEGDIPDDSGTPTTAAKVEVTVGGWTATFSSGFANKFQRSPVPPEARQLFDKMQVQITCTQQTGGTDPTRTNMNALPITIRGFSFREGTAWPEFRRSGWGE